MSTLYVRSLNRVNEGEGPGSSVAGPSEMRIESSVQPVTADEGGRRETRRWTTLLAALVLTIGAAAGWFGWLQAAHADVVASGVQVLGVQLEGFTRGQAETAIAEALGRRGVLTVTLRVADQTFHLPLASLGIEVDVAATVRAVMQRGRAALPFADLHIYVGNGGGAVPLKLRVDSDRYTRGLVVIRDAVDVPAQDASLRLLNGDLSVVPSQDGVAVDALALERAILARVATGRQFDGVVPTVTMEPDVTTAEVEERAATAAAYLRWPIVLRYRSRSLTLSPARLAPLLKINTGAGTQSSPLTFATAAMEAAVRRAFGDVERTAVDATVKVRGNQVVITQSREGARIDMERLIEDLDRVVTGSGSRTVRIRLAAVPPRVTTEELREMGLAALGSEFTTYFSPENEARATNIRRCAELVDGTIVRAGAVFSLNEIVGPRTLNRGFDYAPVIVDGVLREGVGGGVCQFATTLFNAVFFAGLPVVERHCHQFAIEHYPLGRDAAVAWGAADLRFRNDTGRPLMIRTWSDASSLTVVIVGATGRSVQYRTGDMQAVRAPVYTRTHPRIISDATISRGVTRLEQGAPGYAITVNRTVREGNRIVRRDRFFSVYQPRDWVKRVGTRTQ